jgi:serine/threonine protein kinase
LQQLSGSQRDRQRHTIYAMKHLKSKLMSQPENFRLAAAELAVEAHMLASFDHPNVMKIRGWAANGVASFTEGRHDAFFLLLDKLEETLDQRIQKWTQMATHLESLQQQQQQRLESNGNFVNDMWKRLQPTVEEDHMEDVKSEYQMKASNHSDNNGSFPSTQAIRYQEAQLQLEKLGVCSDVASALAYLHDRGVIFRDLKPNNIGFLNGRVQLFDFGLSRELPAGNLDLETPFEMSGKVGTLRYMAVEVACHCKYNVAADVYSWAMVSYEAITLQKPFGGWTRDMHANLVCGRGVRPETNIVASPPLRALLDLAWHQSPHLRPTMRLVEKQIRDITDQQLLMTASLGSTPSDMAVMDSGSNHSALNVSGHNTLQSFSNHSGHSSLNRSGQSIGYAISHSGSSQQQHGSHLTYNGVSLNPHPELAVELPREFRVTRAPPTRNPSQLSEAFTRGAFQAASSSTIAASPLAAMAAAVQQQHFQKQGSGQASFGLK